LTSKISEVRHLSYWDRLKKLNLMSLQRRRERYIITKKEKAAQQPSFFGRLGVTKTEMWRSLKVGAKLVEDATGIKTTSGA